MASGKSLEKSPPSSARKFFRTITKQQKSMMAENELEDLARAERRLAAGFEFGKGRYKLSDDGSLARIAKVTE